MTMEQQARPTYQDLLNLPGRVTTEPAVPVNEERAKKVLGTLVEEPVGDAMMLRRAVVPNNYGGSLTISADMYGITPQNGSRLLSEDFTLAEAVAEYPYCFSAYRRDGWADDRIMGLTRFNAFHADALWWNADWIPMADCRGLCLSRNFIQWPHGGYRITAQLDYGSASRIEGTGTPGTYFPTQKGNTHFQMDEARWVGDLAEPRAIGAYAHGTDSNYGYSEGLVLRYFRVTGFGHDLKKPGKTVTGVSLWDTGEGSLVGPWFTSGCDDGTQFVRGTPTVTAGVISSFSNTGAGFLFSGCSGATVRMDLSADDNSRMIDIKPGYGRPGGLGGSITMVKSEAAITPARFQRPNTVLYGEGWVNLNIAFVSHAIGNNQFQGPLIDFKPSVNTSCIKVTNLRVFAGGNLTDLFHDRQNNKMWKFDNGYISRRLDLEYYSDRNGMLFAKPESYVEVIGQPGLYALKQLPYVSAPYQRQLGFIQGGPDGQPTRQYDYVTGTPGWSDETGNIDGASPTCTWVQQPFGPWGPCVANVETRTATWASSVAGCTPSTPKPADVVETRPCGITPPACSWVLGTPVVGDCVNNVRTTTTPYVSSLAGCTPSAPKPPDVVTTEPCGITPPPGGGSAYVHRTLPGTILAHEFDNGGQGNGYSSVKTAAKDAPGGGVDKNFRPDERVWTEVSPAASGGRNVGWTFDGEWMDYTCNSVAQGIYTVTVRVASADDAPKMIRVKVNGTTVVAKSIPSTGGWQDYRTYAIKNISLPASVNSTVRIEIQGGSFNIDSVQFVKTAQ